MSGDGAKDPYRYFRIEARELLDTLSQGILKLEGTNAKIGLADLETVLRAAHTLKGAAGVVRQPGIAKLCHKLEGELNAIPRFDDDAKRQMACTSALSLLDAMSKELAALDAPAPSASGAGAGAGAGRSPTSSFAPAPVAATPSAAPSAAVDVAVVAAEPGQTQESVRLDLQEVDEVLAAIADVNAQITTMRREGSRARSEMEDALVKIEHWMAARHTSREGWDEGESLLTRLRQVVQSDQLPTSLEGAERSARLALEDARSLRLLPAESLFPELARVVRDAATSAEGGRSGVALQTSGGELRIDANVLTALRDALVQLLRNAIAHGIESDSERRQAGKPVPAKIAVSFERRGTRGIVSVRDNGRGIDLAGLREVLLARGVSRAEIDEADSATALMRIVMRRGGSTRTTATELAGRGVGVQVVGHAMDRLRGTMTVTTKAGEGTEFRLDVPLSVTAAPALIVEIAEQSLSIPLDSVLHTSRVPTQSITRSPRGDTIIDRDEEPVRFASLARLLRPSGTAASTSSSASFTTLVHLSASGERAAISVDRIIGVENEVVLPVPKGAVVDPMVVGAALDGYGDPRVALDPRLLVLAIKNLTGDNVAAVAKREAEAAKKKRVLVIDDSLTSRMLEESILDAAGYDVTTATSAEEGLEIARRSAKENSNGDGFALFVVDVEMPGMSGFDYVAATRADPALAATPAVLVTSRAAPEDKKRGLDAGARAYIVKGEFAQDAFLDAVRRLVG